MNTTLNLGVILTLIVGTILPPIVGRITTTTLHPAVKGLVLATLAGSSAVLGQWIDALNSHTPFAWKTIVVSAFLTYVVAQSAHTNFWSHTTLSNSGTPFGQPPPAKVVSVFPLSVVNTPLTGSIGVTGLSGPLPVVPPQSLTATVDPAPAAFPQWWIDLFASIRSHWWHK